LFCDLSLSLSRSITACMHSLTPHGTSLTIISLPIYHQSTQILTFLMITGTRWPINTT
jgi:hypothetical protein